MERINKPLYKIFLELATLQELREINRLKCLEALERGSFDNMLELKEYWRSRREERGSTKPGAANDACPEGLSPGDEGLWRLRHLYRLGCPRSDLEGLIGLFTSITGVDYMEVATCVFGEGEFLHVR